MMRRLTIIRHAKAEKGGPHRLDFKRKLNKTGEEDAKLMAKKLSSIFPDTPDRIEISPSKRTKQTAQYFIEMWSEAEYFLTYNKDIYEASVTVLLNMIHNWSDEYQNCIIIGHNPGVTSLANHLADDRPIKNIPTCGVVSLTSESKWEQWGNCSCNREFFISPKQYK